MAVVVVPVGSEVEEGDEKTAGVDLVSTSVRIKSKSSSTTNLVRAAALSPCSALAVLSAGESSFLGTLTTHSRSCEASLSVRAPAASLLTTMSPPYIST